MWFTKKEDIEITSGSLVKIKGYANNWIVVKIHQESIM